MALLKEEIEFVNKTARSRGSVGPRALVPKAVLELTLPDDCILDYGAGPEAIHTAALRLQGRPCTYAWEVGKNRKEGVHLETTNDLDFDVVFASNVLNVLPSEQAVVAVLREISNLLYRGGGDTFVFNYPKSPRHSGLMENEIVALIGHFFHSCKKHPTMKGVFIAEIPQR